ncbi:SGNH/GDSL hydrolase family protein [Nocardioides sp. SOB77]|uniref:SGNH/GDSL hydrolase family protein n=1 Tax=Nocardioides oceani TaxID=3058369 RepID=A0ABT8FGT5_9ACTN|nr:SGNH/GDSL hydrolase family protein [Nocardioides oceani]
MERYWPKVAAVIALAVAVIAATLIGLMRFNNEAPTESGGPVRNTPGDVTPAAKAPLAVFIGDSYTAGTGSTGGASFVRVVADTQGWNFENLGEGGTGYLLNTDQDPKLARLGCGKDYCPNYPEVIAAAVEAEPDIVVVSGGRNNVTASTDDLDAGIPAFFEQLRDALPEATIYATSPLWDVTEPPEELGRLADIVRASVQSVGGTYLDLGQPLDDPGLLARDKIHPDNEGHLAIADAINKKLR